MYRFIPSWYSNVFKWHANETLGREKRDGYEFDDTVNQVRMFLSAGEDVEIMVLAYMPRMRSFLHRQGLSGVRVFSVFDKIQGIDESRCGLLSYLDLEWPDDVEFVFSPFVISAFSQNRYFARVELSQEGTLLWIDFLGEDGKTAQRKIFDDRGFLSSTLFFEEERVVRQDFFDMAGRLVLRNRIAEGKLERFSNGTVKRAYASEEEMISKVLGKHLTSSAKEDTIIIASKEQHNAIAIQAAKGRSVVLSYFEDRFDLSKEEELQQDTSFAKLIVTDTEHTARQIREIVGGKTPIYDISPFDTRLSLGKSQRIRELKVFMPIDFLEEPFRGYALTQIFAFMQKNPDVRLLVGTTDPTKRNIRSLIDGLRDALEKNQVEGIFVEDEEEEKEPGENELEEEEVKPRIFIKTYLSETDLIRILYDTRLILDVSDQPDLYLQIAGISAGIPQINYRFTRYVEHLKDGFIIQNIHHVTEGLEYYLTGLANWNEALVYCIQEIIKYTGGNLVAKWKELVAGNEI